MLAFLPEGASGHKTGKTGGPGFRTKGLGPPNPIGPEPTFALCPSRQTIISPCRRGRVFQEQARCFHERTMLPGVGWVRWLEALLVSLPLLQIACFDASGASLDVPRKVSIAACSIWPHIRCHRPGARAHGTGHGAPFSGSGLLLGWPWAGVGRRLWLTGLAEHAAEALSSAFSCCRGHFTCHLRILMPPTAPQGVSLTRVSYLAVSASW